MDLGQHDGEACSDEDVDTVPQWDGTGCLYVHEGVPQMGALKWLVPPT